MLNKPLSSEEKTAKWGAFCNKWKGKDLPANFLSNVTDSIDLLEKELLTLDNLFAKLSK